MKLSICVVTMNRAKQLAEALQSCLACELPQDTEFVIIDNASTDHTEQVVKDVLDNSGYDYCYEKMSENLGCGGGRNYAYNHAGGELVYVLDDDAVIDEKNSKDFFVKAIKIFDEFPDIVSLTSQIYDTAWGENRLSANGKPISDGLYRRFMFCGGSHFLRKAFFEKSPYLSNQYGYEELPPSLKVIDHGKTNAFCPDMLIIHKPAVNKWNWNEEKNISMLVNTVVMPYVIKRKMYPRCAYPLISLFYYIRKRKYLTGPESKQKANDAVKELMNEYKIEYKVRFKTLCFLISTFGAKAL